VFRKRWQPVGLLALGLFLVNALARFISWKAGIEDADSQTRVAFIGLGAVAVVTVVVGARWSIRYPFSRVFGDTMLAVLISTVLSVTVGPLAGGVRPFQDSVEFLVLEVLLFFVLGAVAMIIGFTVVTAFGKDWKSRGLKRYEQRYSRHKPKSAVR
jgi:hypothetical protein